MAGGPPQLQIGAEGYLGFVLQDAFGAANSGAPTAAGIPANTNNWVEFTAIDLSYDAAQHAIETGAGTRATERKAGRGMSRTTNGFTILGQPTAGAALLARFFGKDVYAAGPPATHTITPTQPQLLQFEKQMAGQALQYIDCLLDTLVMQQSGAEWAFRYTVAGGLGDTPVASSTPTMPTDALVMQWGDVTLTTPFGGITQGEMSAITLTFNNNVRQFQGAGSYAPTKARGGKLQVSGTCTYLFDSAAGATALANYIAGTESDLTVTVTKDSTHALAIVLPKSHMTASRPNETLDELVQVEVSWFVRQAEGISLVLKNDVVTSYAP